MKHTLAIALLAVALCGCRPEPTPTPEIPKATLTLAQMREVIRGYTIVEWDAVIVARVLGADSTQSDVRALAISDGTCRAELLTGLYDNLRVFPVGSVVALDARGLAAVPRDSVVVIGLPCDATTLRPRPTYITHSPLLWHHIRLWPNP